MPFQTPQGLDQLMALFRAMQGPQQQNTNNIQGMMGLQNPFGAGPQQSVFPNVGGAPGAAPPPSFQGAQQAGGLPITQYGYGAEKRFHDPYQFEWPEIAPKSAFARWLESAGASPKPVSVESRQVGGNAWDSEDDDEGDEGGDDPGDGDDEGEG